MIAEWNVLRLTLHRYRNLYGGMALYSLLLLVIPHLGIPVADLVIGFLTVPYALGILAALGAFAHPETDLAGDAPALPMFMMRLPVETRTLAVPPLLGSMICGALGWIVLSMGFLAPLGVHVPAAWPAALLACLGPLIMAVQWAPLRSGKSRLSLALVLPMVPILVSLWLANFPGGAERTLPFLVVLAGTASGVAWAGLASSRINGGGRVERAIPPQKVVTGPVKPRPPFSSPLTAQRWLEWHQQSRYVPMFTALVLTMISIPLLFDNARREIIPDSEAMGNLYAMTALPFMFVVPLLMATAVGMGARRSEALGSTGLYRPFFATRPVDGSLLLRAKNEAAALGAFAAWGITLAFVTLWMLTPANQGGETYPLGYFLLQQFPTSRIFDVMLILGIMVFWTWRNQAVGTIADFLPTRKGPLAYALTVTITGCLGLMLISLLDPHWNDPRGNGTFIGLLTLYLIVRGAVAFCVAYSLLGRRESTLVDVGKAGMSWFLGGLTGAAAITLNPTLFSSLFSGALSFPSGALFSFALMPLVRPLAARLALEKGRHG